MLSKEDIGVIDEIDLMVFAMAEQSRNDVKHVLIVMDIE